MRTSAGSFYYTTDALGSVILFTDSTQAKAATYGYDSWGNATSTGAPAANNPWQYAGGYYEASTPAGSGRTRDRRLTHPGHLKGQRRFENTAINGVFSPRT